MVEHRGVDRLLQVHPARRRGAAGTATATGPAGRRRGCRTRAPAAVAQTRASGTGSCAAGARARGRRAAPRRARTSGPGCRGRTRARGWSARRAASLRSASRRSCCPSGRPRRCGRCRRGSSRRGRRSAHRWWRRRTTSRTRRPAAGRTCCGQARLPAARRTGPHVARGRVADERGPFAHVRRIEQVRHLERRRVAEPRLAVGHRQLPGLGDRVDPLGRVGVEGARSQVVEAQLVQDGEHLEQRRPLPPEPGLRDLHAVPLRRPTGASQVAEKAARSAPATSPGSTSPPEWRHSRGRKASTASATKPCPHARRAASACAAASGPAAPASATSRSSTEAYDGLANSSPARGTDPPGSHRSADVDQWLSNSSRTRVDGRGHAREQRMSVAGVADGRLEHGRERQAAVVAQQEQPGVDRAGDRRRQRTRARDVVEPHGQERLTGGAPPVPVPDRTAPAGPGRRRWPRSRAGRRPGR